MNEIAGAAIVGERGAEKDWRCGEVRGRDAALWLEAKLSGCKGMGSEAAWPNRETAWSKIPVGQHCMGRFAVRQLGGSAKALERFGQRASGV